MTESDLSGHTLGCVLFNLFSRLVGSSWMASAHDGWCWQSGDRFLRWEKGAAPQPNGQAEERLKQRRRSDL